MTFIPGLRLNEGFYSEIVAPLLEQRYPRLEYSAALMGYGSDVLGFDTPTSMDHNWGPRMQIFLSPGDFAQYGAELTDFFRRSLPLAYRGFPTNFCPPRYDRTQSMEATPSHPVNHLIEITTIESFVGGYLGTASAEAPSVSDWLAFDDQKLLEVTSGEVFHDGLERLRDVRARFAFFPRDVLLCRLAGLWKLIEEDEPLIGRTIETGSMLATKIIAGHLVECCIKICLYLEGKYLPYNKWLVRSFQTTRCNAEVQPLCTKALSVDDPLAIEESLCALYEKVVELNNRRADLPGLANQIRTFFGRPYKVIFAETIVAALKGAIADPEVARRC